MPAGDSGRPYTSLDERCAACVIYGGDEKPCRPAGELNVIEEEKGRPCPRVDLWEDNFEAWAIVRVLINSGLHGILDPVLDGVCGWMPAEERLRVLRRVIRAMNDPAVHAELYPKPKSSGPPRTPPRPPRRPPLRRR